jgi:hypothetical protein
LERQREERREVGRRGRETEEGIEKGGMDSGQWVQMRGREAANCDLAAAQARLLHCTSETRYFTGCSISQNTSQWQNGWMYFRRTLVQTT